MSVNDGASSYAAPIRTASSSMEGVATETTTVVHLPTGRVLRRASETELPAGLSRTAVAYLSSIVDHTGPSA